MVEVEEVPNVFGKEEMTEVANVLGVRITPLVPYYQMSKEY